MIFGLQSVAELNLLVQQFDNDIAAMRPIADKIKSPWMSANPTEQKDWANDYNQLVTRYQNARNIAKAKIAITPTATASLVPADSEYLDVLKSFHQNATSTSGATGAQEKGDFGDVFTRLQIASNTYGGGQIQQKIVDPNQAPDVDLETYKVLGNVDVIGNPKSKARGVLTKLGLLLGGVLAIFIGYKVSK